jgi:hypothetical protein
MDEHAMGSGRVAALLESAELDIRKTPLKLAEGMKDQREAPHGADRQNFFGGVPDQLLGHLEVMDQEPGMAEWSVRQSVPMRWALRASDRNDPSSIVADVSNEHERLETELSTIRQIRDDEIALVEARVQGRGPVEKSLDRRSNHARLRTLARERAGAISAGSGIRRLIFTSVPLHSGFDRLGREGRTPMPIGRKRPYVPAGTPSDAGASGRSISTASP